MVLSGVAASSYLKINNLGFHITLQFRFSYYITYFKLEFYKRSSLHTYVWVALKHGFRELRVDGARVDVVNLVAGIG